MVINSVWRRKFSPILAFLLGAEPLLVWAQAVDHRPDPRQLFEKMRLASFLYSYEGAMTYEHDGQLSSFHMSSGETDGGWVQGIRFLSGPERQFAQPINLCGFDNVGQLRSRITEDTDDLALSYNFQSRSEFRIAGRQAQEVLVTPADGSRYGYNFAVDMETGLMLHAVTLDPQRNILERFQFISIESGPATRNFQSVQAQCVEASDAVSGVETGEVPWELAWVPSGFKRVKIEHESMRTQLVYSDGLATFSVFIELLDEVRFPPATTSFGATSLMLNYYLVRGDTFAVTVVGELPLTTLQSIAAQLHYLESDDAG